MLSRVWHTLKDWSDNGLFVRRPHRPTQVQVQVAFLFGGESPGLGRTVSIFNVDVFRSLGPTNFVVLAMAWIGK